MPDVAIIGGGVIGWSSAYHLLKAEPSLRIEVFERLPSFGMGSTGRAAGGVRAQFGTAVNVDLSLHSIAFFESVRDEVGLSQNGYLFVTASQKGAEHLQHVTAMQRERGVPVSLLTAAEVAECAPYIFSKDVLAGAFSPKDGYLDPYAVCQTFERAARAMGAIARYGNVFDSFHAKTVVLCAGHWSMEVGQKLGFDLPVRAEKHQLAMAERVDGLPDKLPMVVDLDTSFHFRREGQGLLIGYNDPESQGGDPDAEPVFDYGFLERLAKPALHRLPLLERYGFDTKKSWAGFYAETPDRHAIIGKVGDVVVATGFGGHGIMHSPAAGLAVSEIVLTGESKTLDIHALRPQRFADGQLTLEQMVI